MRPDTGFLSERVVRLKLLRALCGCLTIYGGIVVYSYVVPGMTSRAPASIAGFLGHISHFADDAYAVTMNRAFGTEIGIALILSVIMTGDALLAYIRCRAGAFGLNGLEAREMAAYVLRQRRNGLGPDRWSPEPLDQEARRPSLLDRLLRPLRT